MTNMNSNPVLPGRSCAGCTMCCKLLSITELQKPRQQWCGHCDQKGGCKIYDERPSECGTFYCGYLGWPGLGDEWKPSKSKLVLTTEFDGLRILIHVDAATPLAWRKPIYYRQIKQWALKAAGTRNQVVVYQGDDVVVVLPDRDENLGPLNDRQVIAVENVVRNGQPHTVVKVVDVDDPSLMGKQVLRNSR